MAEHPASPRSSLGRVDLMLRGDCNVDCTFCYQDIFSDPTHQFDFSHARVVETLEAGRRRGYDEVYISGGEPTMGDALPGTVSLARSLGYGRVKVMTNGIRLASAGYADALAGAGLTGIAFSLHGPSAPIHALHTASPRSFHLLLQGLQNMLQRHPLVETEVNSVVTRHNVGCLEELARLVSSFGVGELHLQHVVPASPGAQEMMPDPDSLRAALRRVVDRCPDGLHVSIAFVPYCWMRGYEHHLPRFDFTVDFFSNCPAMFTGWRDALLAAKEEVEACGPCPDFACCRGLWRRPPG